MLPVYKAKAKLWLGVGVILCFFVAGSVHSHAAAWAAFSAGAALLVYGGCCLMHAKGYPWPLGFLGLLSVVGLFVMILLPDKHPEPAEPQPATFPPPDA